LTSKETASNDVSSSSLGVRLAGRHNNFDLLRILAAFQVATVHICTYLKLDGGRALQVLAVVPGVPVFFVISGFLVSDSLERLPLSGYALNRLLRIYPALWMSLAVAVFAAAHWGNVALWRDPGFVGWLGLQLLTGGADDPAALHGFGVGTLNGSLWTIPVELEFYLLLPIVTVAISRSRDSLATLALFIAASLTLTLIFGHQRTAPWAKAAAGTLAPYLYTFLLGVALRRAAGFTLRWVVGKPLLWGAIFALVTIGLGSVGFSVRGNELNPLSSALLATVVVAIAFVHLPFRLTFDLSYGLYLYHMIVVNVLVAIGGVGSYILGLAALVFSLVLALMSWVLVEHPFLKLRYHERKRSHQD